MTSDVSVVCSSESYNVGAIYSQTVPLPANWKRPVMGPCQSKSLSVEC